MSRGWNRLECKGCYEGTARYLDPNEDWSLLFVMNRQSMTHLFSLKPRHPPYPPSDFSPSHTC